MSWIPMKLTPVTIAIGTFGVLAVGAAVAGVALLSPPPRADNGGGLASTSLGNVPQIRSDPTQSLDTNEADRRVTKNNRDSKAAEAKGASYIASAVMTTEHKQVEAPPPPPKAPLPEVAKVDPQTVALVVAPPTPPPANQQKSESDNKRDVAFESEVKKQIDDLVRPGGSRWATVAFKIPAPPPKPEPRPAAAKPAPSGPSGQGGPQQPAYVEVLAAKPGDGFYARLTVGFNSDDPAGLPVFATIHDERPDATYGPLHGARGMGSVVYADNQAAVVIQRLILADGREAPTKAMLVTIQDVRSGVAENVDFHTLSRWSGLLAASLIQGAGQAGQQLLSNNRSVFLSPGGYASVGQPGIDWGQAGLAALAPLGQNFAAIARQNFSQRPTMSAAGGPNGSEVGIVFLETVTIPMLPPAGGGLVGGTMNVGMSAVPGMGSTPYRSRY